MMHQVIVHRQAKEDIGRNAGWWADHHSVEQALVWIDAVEEQLQELSHHPERFGVAEENGSFSYEIRQVLVGLGNRRSYRAIYTIRGDVVHVLAVLRAEQGTIGIGDLPETL